MEDRVVPAAPGVDPLLVTTESNVVDPGDGVVSLREAIITANGAQAGQQQRIRFADNLNGKTIKFDIQLTLEKNIVIDGLGRNITIERNAGSGEIRLFWVKDGPEPIVTLIGLTLKNGGGPAVDFGGAIKSDGQLTLQDCTIQDSKAEAGGAVAVMSGTLDIVNCTIRDNEALGDMGEGMGGGIFVGPNVTTVNITNTAINFNSATGRGGGIMIWGLTASPVVTLSGVSLLGNTAGDKGGSVCVDNVSQGNPQLRLTNGTLISGNTVLDPNGKGGGAYVGGGSLYFDGVQFVSNTATTGTGLYAVPNTPWGQGPGGYLFVNDTWEGL